MRIQEIVLIVALGLLVILARPDGAKAAARLIKVPLTSETTQGTGQLGQASINYYASISVGTPAKAFKVQFDLDTDELFLPHYSWNPFNRNMHYTNGFQCKASSTCHKDNTEYKFEYQHAKLTGKRYKDKTSLDMVYTNETDSQRVSSVSWQQDFMAVSSVSDGRFAPLPVDGFFGLGPSTQSMSGVRSILSSLHKSNLIDNLQVSFWFNPVLDHPNGGLLVLGGVDTNLFQGKIYWHHLASSSSRWSLVLQTVQLGQQTVACSGPYGPNCEARFSTGLSDIYGPREAVERLYTWLSTTKSSSGLQLIDCRRIPSLPHMTFYIDGIPYYLPATNYVRKTQDGSIFKRETCYVAVLPSLDDDTTWTLATPFLGAYYSIFDTTYRMIGFASLK